MADQIVPLPIFAMVAMPNHWHFIVRPTTDDQVSEFFRRLSVMHTMRYHAHYKTSGTGHLYQGRFKSFPIQSDEHLLIAMRYVERNPVRANFVDLAEDWQWGSAYTRQQSANKRRWLATPADPPLPRQWRSWVNKAETDAEVKALRHCITRGLPFGEDRWTKSSTVRLHLESTTGQEVDRETRPGDLMLLCVTNACGSPNCSARSVIGGCGYPSTGRSTSAGRSNTGGHPTE